MTDNEFRLLSQLPEVVSPADLTARIIKTIAAAKTRRIRVRFAAVLSCFLASLGYAAMNWAALWADIRTSSFYSLLRLAVSDPDVAFANLTDFVLGLLETLPLGAMLLVLVSVFFLVITAALANALRNVKRARFIHLAI
jgi:hypothetical protein